MRLKTFVVNVVAMTVGFGCCAYATNREFYPPERINCKPLYGNKFRCSGIDREIISEDKTNAVLQRGVEETFNFTSAVAFLRSDHKSNIFFTYKNAQSKLLRLKSIDTYLHPDFVKGGWEKLSYNMYHCNSGYMRCSLSDDALSLN